MKNDKNTKSYPGIPVVEAKLRMLADAAVAAADAYRDDPVRKACRKAGVKQAVGKRFFFDALDELNDRMLKVDNIVHGWDVEWVKDMTDPTYNRDPVSRKKYKRIMEADKE